NNHVLVLLQALNPFPSLFSVSLSILVHLFSIHSFIPSSFSTMATGDVHNNAAKVRRTLLQLQYPHDANEATRCLAYGTAREHLSELLSVLHFSLLDYSRFVAERVRKAELELYGKTDAKFVDGVFRFARDELGYLPALTSLQFLAPMQFRERKLIVLHDILTRIMKMHVEEQRNAKRNQCVWVSGDENAKGLMKNVKSPIEMNQNKESNAWMSVNLGQPKTPRIIRHVVKENPIISHVLPLKKLPEPEPEILDWNTPIDGGNYKPVDKSLLDPIQPAITPNWIESHYKQDFEYDIPDEDMYPRQLCVQPSEDPVKPLPIERPANDFKQAFAKLDSVLTKKLDDILDLVSSNFSLLDARLARLETKLDACSVPKAEHPNQENEASKLVNAPRINTSSMVYRWPPEPSVFRKI
ncbi:hypothetical protein THRCLA_03242, partial [Thraustotheca clavata]